MYSFTDHSLIVSWRKEIANFRLGNFMWQSPKMDSVRVCPLCREVESFQHIVFDCPATVGLIQELGVIKALVSPSSIERVSRLLKFVKEFFQVRSNIV